MRNHQIQNLCACSRGMIAALLVAAIVLLLAAAPAVGGNPFSDPGIKISESGKNKSLLYSVVYSYLFVSVWSEEVSTGVQKLYTQRLNTSGDVLWGSNGKRVCNSSGNQYAAGIVSDGLEEGGIVFWTDDRNGSGTSTLWAQRLDKGGDAMWNPQGMLVGTGSNQQYSASAFGDGAGGAVVTWQSQGAVYNDVWAQHLDANGKPKWGNSGKKLTSTGSKEMLPLPKLAQDRGGQYVIVWQSYDGSTCNVWAQRLNLDGNTGWSAGGRKIATASKGADKGAYPAINSNGKGGTFCTWNRTIGNTDDSDTMAQQLDEGGNAVWNSADVKVNNAPSDGPTYPQVAGDGEIAVYPQAASNVEGGAFVVWQNKSGSEYSTLVQALDGGGIKLWNKDGVQLNSWPSKKYTSPKIVYVGEGNVGAVVVWQSFNGSSYSTWAQRLDAMGNQLWGRGGRKVTTASGNPRDPAIYLENGYSVIVTYGTGGTSDKYSGIYEREFPLLYDGSYIFYFAEGTTRPGFDPYFCVQNLGAEDTKVTVNYGLGDGTTKTQEATVGPNSRATINPKDVIPSTDGPASDFSAKVESSNGQPLVVEEPIYFNYKPGVLNWTGGHRVMGATDPSTAWYFAEGTTRPGFDPYFCVWNPGTETAQVTVNYGLGDGTTKTQETTVGPNSRATINPKDVIPSTDDPFSDFSASVVSTNGQPLVVEEPIYFNYKPGVLNWNGGHRVMGATALSTDYYFAEGTTRPGFDPYFCVQNRGTETAQVKVNYYLGDGTTKTQEAMIPTGSRATINPKDVIPSTDDPSSDFSASVVSTNGQPLVVEEPIYFNYKPGVLDWTGGNRVMGTDARSTTFYFAEGTTRPGFDPYFSVENMGLSDAHVTVKYGLGDGTTKTQEAMIPTGSRGTINPKDVIPSTDSPASDFSATVSSSEAALVEQTMYFNYRPGVLNWTGGHRVMGLEDKDAVIPVGGGDKPSR